MVDFPPMNYILLNMEKSKNLSLLYFKYHTKSQILSILFPEKNKTSEEYNQRIQKCLEIKQESKVVALLEEMKEKQIKLNNYSMKQLSKYYIKNQNLSKIQEICKMILDKEVIVNEEVYNFLIPYLYEKKELEYYHKFMILMKEQEIKKTPRINYTIILNLLELGKKEEILKFISDRGFQKNIDIYNIFIQILLEKKDFEKIKEILNEINLNSIFKEDKTYDLLFTMYILQKDFENIHSLFQEFTNQGKRASNELKIYFKLMIFFYKRFEYEKVEEVIQFMFLHGLELNEPLYNFIITYKLTRKQINTAKQLLQEMKMKKYTISEEIYTNFITYFGEIGKWDLCQKFLLEFNVPLNTLYLSMLKHYFPKENINLE